MDFPRRLPDPATSPRTSPPGSRFALMRARLQSSTGRLIASFMLFVAGILLGIILTLLYELAIASHPPVLAKPNSQIGNIIVQSDKIFLTHLIENNLRASGMPGDIKNVQIQLVNGAQVTIDGEDAFSVLGIGVTRHFTLIVQPFVNACQIQVHVLHADLSGIPVTGFVASFENQINQDLRSKQSGLPAGFTYCTIGVRTEPDGLFVTYSATPLSN